MRTVRLILGLIVLSFLLVSGGASGIALAGDVDGGDGLAISHFNGRAYIVGGWLDDSVNGTGMVAVGGSLATPIGRYFGVQGDTALAFSHGEFGGGVAGHVFWRDPSAGLFGIYGQWVARHQPNWKTWRGGLEAQSYLGDWDLRAIVGFEEPVLPAGYASHHDIFAIADVGYYFSDNVQLSIGYRYLNGFNIGAVDFKFLSPDASRSKDLLLTLSGRIGEFGYAAAWLDLTMLIGAPQISLRDHYRKYSAMDTEKENIFQVDIQRAYGR